MKITLIILVLGILNSASAQEPKSEPKDMQKDLRVLCELAKFKQTLSNSLEFKDETPDVAARIAEMALTAIKTSEIKKAFQAISMADANSKKDLWKKVAKEDAGMKNWHCPEMKKL